MHLDLSLKSDLDTCRALGTKCVCEGGDLTTDFRKDCGKTSSSKDHKICTAYSHNSIIRPVRWAKLAMYCRFGYRTVSLIELKENPHRFSDLPTTLNTVPRAILLRIQLNDSRRSFSLNTMGCNIF